MHPHIKMTNNYFFLLCDSSVCVTGCSVCVDQVTCMSCIDGFYYDSTLNTCTGQ